MLIPNAALRFKPPVSSSDSSKESNVMSMLLPRPPGGNREAPKATSTNKIANENTASETSDTNKRDASSPQARNASAAGGNGGKRGKKNGGAADGMTRSSVWIKTAEGGMQNVNVLLGATDGKFTEVRSRDLKEGDEVITSINLASKK